MGARSQNEIGRKNCKFNLFFFFFCVPCPRKNGNIKKCEFQKHSENKGRYNRRLFFISLKQFSLYTTFSREQQPCNSVYCCASQSIFSRLRKRNKKKNLKYCWCKIIKATRTITLGLCGHILPRKKTLYPSSELGIT